MHLNRVWCGLCFCDRYRGPIIAFAFRDFEVSIAFLIIIVSLAFLIPVGIVWWRSLFLFIPLLLPLFFFFVFFLGVGGSGAGIFLQYIYT